jgi:hypothetical protein
MLKACRNRNKYGPKFDTRLQAFWKSKYTKSNSSQQGENDDGIQPNRQRVVTHSDLTIQELVAQCDTSPAASVLETEE